MRTPWVKMRSGVLLSLGRFHLSAISRDEATKELVAGFKPKMDDLAAAKRAREEAEDGLIDPRVALGFAGLTLKAVLHEIAALAKTADNRVGGNIVFRALFPSGTVPVLRPRAASQLEAATALRGRLDAQPAAQPVKAQVLAALDDAIGALAKALAARDAAEEMVTKARAVENGARAAFVSAYDSNAGAIRRIFPRNRERQDLHFDHFGSVPSAAPSTPPSPNAPSTPAKTSDTPDKDKDGSS